MAEQYKTVTRTDSKTCQNIQKKNKNPKDLNDAIKATCISILTSTFLNDITQQHKNYCIYNYNITLKCENFISNIVNTKLVVKYITQYSLW